jgi:outer membrane lipoprotein-sorting protein
MNKFLRFGLMTFALAFVFSAFAATETKAQGVLNDILNRMDQHNKLLKTLQADIKMAKLNAQLGESDITEGTVKYLPGASEKNIYVRIDWAKPVVEHLAVANGQYVLYRPNLKQAIVGKVDKKEGNAKASGALSFMGMNKAQLKANYDVKYIGQETVTGGIQTWHLELTPKNASSYKSADLWVDGNGMPVQAKVTEKNNDTTTVLLSNLQKNLKISGDTFSIKPPKGTKIVNG